SPSFAAEAISRKAERSRSASHCSCARRSRESASWALSWAAAMSAFLAMAGPLIPRLTIPRCEDGLRMAVMTSEAVVLRTWPVHESDLIVSFFTRDYGKMRGVAKSALKSRKRFGGALEPMTEARAWFAERPRQELVRLDQLEIVRSPLALPVDATRLGVLSFYA